jgi:hypothetical protein
MMAGVPMPAYQQFSAEKRPSLKIEYQPIVDKYPDATPAIKLLFKVVCGIE